MYAYCGNNPVSRKDSDGEAFETVFDIISLFSSLGEVLANPSNPWAWAQLAGDVIDVAVPFLTGVGETVKGVRSVVRVIDGADDVIDAARTFRRSADKGTEVKEAVGAYVVLFKNGDNYVGKGPFNRAITSAKNHQKQGGGVSSLIWVPASSDDNAFIAEYLLQTVRKVQTSNGANTMNVIWSPGMNLDKLYRRS